MGDSEAKWFAMKFNNSCYEKFRENFHTKLMDGRKTEERIKSQEGKLPIPKRNEESAAARVNLNQVEIAAKTALEIQGRLDGKTILSFSIPRKWCQLYN